MTDKSTGLTRAAGIYQNRSSRVKELKAQGKRIIGYPCAYVPLEMLTALNLVPYRTYGSIKEPITEADRTLPASFCPFIRSCFDCALKGKEGFLDGMVVAHSCDPQEKTARLWESYVHYPFFQTGCEHLCTKKTIFYLKILKIDSYFFCNLGKSQDIRCNT